MRRTVTFHWKSLGGYEFGEALEVYYTYDISGMCSYQIPKLDIAGYGIRERDAYGKLLLEFELGLKRHREGIWGELRKLNRIM